MLSKSKKPTAKESRLRDSFCESLRSHVDEKNIFELLDDELNGVVDKFFDVDMAAAGGAFALLAKQAVEGWKMQDKKTKSKWPVLVDGNRWGLMFGNGPCNNRGINLLDPMFEPIFAKQDFFEPLFRPLHDHLRLKFLPCAFEEVRILIKKQYGGGVSVDQLDMIIEQYIQV